MDDDRTVQKTSASEDPTVVSKGGVGAEDPPISQESKKQLEFSADEETLIIRMYSLVGERWSLIAGRIPERSAEEIERYWNSRQSTSSVEKPENSVLDPTQLDHNQE